MKRKFFFRAIGIGLIFTSFSAVAEAPFGGEKDIAYAEKLWKQLEKHNLIGENRTMSAPYEGVHPHGAFLDTIERSFKVEGNTGPVIVKRNYGGEELSKEKVWDSPDEYLQAVTVMYQREGYDPDNNNWFYAKYKPDGSIDTNPKDMKLAGRVGKNMKAGCIACHANAPGEDFVFAHDRYQ
ncbi:cytochrome P460 family protein [Marinobacter sp.]|uniref:cytochrome P460 family protein n=1 Tax=Marinobacter sp. TaxID=50741 RepID=UPI00384CA7C5